MDEESAFPKLTIGIFADVIKHDVESVICFFVFGLYPIGFPSPSPLSPTTVRVVETEWDPIRGSATRNWFEECIRKTKKLQIFCSTSVALLVYSFFRIFTIYTERVFEVPRIFNYRCPLNFRFDMSRDDHLTSLP